MFVCGGVRVRTNIKGVSFFITPCLFEARSLPEPRAHIFSGRSEASKPQRSSCFCYLGTEVPAMSGTSGLLGGGLDPNPGPHGCTENINSQLLDYLSCPSVVKGYYLNKDVWVNGIEWTDQLSSCTYDQIMYIQSSFQQMVLGKLDIHRAKGQVGPLP